MFKRLFLPLGLLLALLIAFIFPAPGRFFRAAGIVKALIITIFVALEYSVTSALAVCVIFHFFQLLIDSLLAAKVNHAITD